MEALRGASVMDEHRVLMGAVIEKVQSAKSGLNEACSSLLIGFEVSDIEREKPQVDSSRHCPKFGETNRTEVQSFVIGD